MKPGSSVLAKHGISCGYTYGIKKDTDDSEKHIAYIDIKYLSEMLCNYAEKYYDTKDPDEFKEHTFELE